MRLPVSSNLETALERLGRADGNPDPSRLYGLYRISLILTYMTKEELTQNELVLQGLVDQGIITRKERDVVRELHVIGNTRATTLRKLHMNTAYLSRTEHSAMRKIIALEDDNVKSFLFANKLLGLVDKF